MKTPERFPPDDPREWLNRARSNMAMKKKPAESRFALCIENRACEDFEKRKIYEILPDEEAAREGYLRVIDECGKDSLYPESYFIVIELTRKAREALVAAG